MISQIITTVISLLIFYGIMELIRAVRKRRVVKNKNAPKQRKFNPKTDDPSDWVGRRPNTKAEQKKIDAQMKRFLENNPNFTFWKDHPEYVEKYLDEIDLKELGFNDKNELPK